MKRIVRVLAIALLAVLVSAGALAGYVLLVLDPNDYKTELSALVKRKADMDLALNGRLVWQFYPNLGISLGAATLTDPASRDRLAAIEQAAVSIKLMPLLAGQASINAVRLDGADLRLVKHADGSTSWDRLLDRLKSPDDEPSKQVAVDVRVLDVRNARLTLVDEATQVTRSIERIAIEASDIDPQAEFPLAARFRVSQRDATGKVVTADNDLQLRLHPDLPAKRHVLRGLQLTSALSGSGLPAPLKLALTADSVTADLANGHHAVQGLSLQTDYQAAKPVSATLKTDVSVDVPNGQADLKHLQLEARVAAAGLPEVLPVSLRSDLAANWKTGVISLPALVLQAADVRTEGRLAISLPALASGAQPATRGMTLNGQLRTAAFNPRELMARLGLKPPMTRNPEVLKRVSLNTDLVGGETELMARNLRLQLDGSTLTGEAGVRELPAARLVARLNLDRLNADDYLPPPDKPAAEAPKPDTTQRAAGLLPVNLLRSQNLDVSLDAGKLDILSYPITGFRVAASARAGLVDVSALSGRIYDGSFNVPVSIDVRGAQPVIRLRPEIRQVDLGPIAKQVLKKDLFTGRMNFNGAVSVTGNDADAWLRSAQGPNTLRLDQGRIQGVNVVDGLFAALGQYQALLPALTGRDAAALKGKVRDTEIVSLLGEMTLNQGVVNNQSMKADLKDVQVGGSGSYNLLTQDVDYRFQLKLDRKYWGARYQQMADTPIPVRCNGNLKGSVATLCGLDRDGMQGLVVQMAQARAVEAIDQQKARLDQKIDQKLGDKLPPQQKEAVKQLLDNLFKR